MQDANTLIKQLLEAGVHFGHQTNRWNPKMAKYIFGEKNGIYIIDLQKTFEYIKNAAEFLRTLTSEGKYVLFVGTKKQAQGIIKDQAIRCQMPYVVERWLGGTLTNFSTIRKSIKRLEDIEKLKEEGTFDLLSKKERAQITKEFEKLVKNLGGIRDMTKLPGALFVIDSKDEEIAVKEAKKLSIPVVALVDTNANPDIIDYIIPGNDDALKSIELISQIIAENTLEGRQLFLKGKPEVKEKAKAKEKELKADEEEVEKLLDGEAVKKDQVKEERIKKKPHRRRTKAK